VHFPYIVSNGMFGDVPACNMVMLVMLIDFSRVHNIYVNNE
jgi:hypothetical protein